MSENIGHHIVRRPERLLVSGPRRFQKIDEPWIVDRLNRCSSMVIGGHELKATVGCERRTDGLGPTWVFVRFVKPRLLEFLLGVVRPVPERVNHLHDRQCRTAVNDEPKELPK